MTYSADVTFKIYKKKNKKNSPLSLFNKVLNIWVKKLTRQKSIEVSRGTACEFL